MSRVLTIPETCLVVLVGVSGSGKSTFARRHFRATEVLSSDFCRGLVSDDENDQSATSEAFALLHHIADLRLRNRRLVVVDATNVQREARSPLVKLARKHHFFAVAIVLDVDRKICHQRNQDRPDRGFGPHVVRQQASQMRRSMRGLKREGFRFVHVLKGPEEIESATIDRQRLWTNKRDEKGPFDIIGDVHGCADELEELLHQLGYEAGAGNERVYRHPAGRRVVFVGDLVDRGPRILDSIEIARGMVASGSAFCVPGNHDVKLVRKLRGKNVQITHGLADSLAEIDRLSEAEREARVEEMVAFLDSLVSHYVFDGGRLVVAHAGMKEAFQGRSSGKVREFALFGETTGETDEFGLPIRWNWAAEYRGRAAVVYGHTPVQEPEWLNHTINIDTGCVFGGSLTALRYPEMELVSVPAKRTYADPIRPIQPVAQGPLSAQQQLDEVLDFSDVSGKRIVSTPLQRNITIREEQVAAALEVMSRFAIDPRMLIYLPPTMSPSETSSEAGCLEHPREAFRYFRNQSVATVVCQQKHMGSRAVVIVCRDDEACLQRFGVSEEGAGIVYSRTGRRFFADRELELEMLDRVRSAIEQAGLWEVLRTDWLCLDCELMPWSAKAQALLAEQYAPVGSAATGSLTRAAELLAAADREELQPLLRRTRRRAELASRYVDAYRRYCWSVESVTDLRLAPFHLLASETSVHVDKDHHWHLSMLRKICQADPDLLLATSHQTVDLTDTESEAAATEWWVELTAQGEEGMVVKPLEFVARGRRGVAQPAVKCRGAEYLRIIYGPEYDLDEQRLNRLRTRGLGRKRSLAIREFALGVEGLQRFVRREPLRRVHECVFGVLALESEPVDPRL